MCPFMTKTCVYKQVKRTAKQAHTNMKAHIQQQTQKHKNKHN